MAALDMTSGSGLDVEYVPDTGPAPTAAAAPDAEEDRSEVLSTVELAGKRFPVSDRAVPLLSLMKLATIAKRQALRPPGTPADQADEMESMSILYELVRSVITEQAWPEFEDHANTVGAGMPDLRGVIEQAAEARAARPTQPPSSSPGGPSTTAPNSAGSSSPPASSIRQGDVGVQRRLEEQGRPDLALVVQRAREASTPSSRA
jgi:hypothetical protein